jgi:hypothetical protein
MTVTVANVRAVIKTTATDEQVTEAINTAVLMTTRCSSGWDTELTDKINTYVAAHVLTSTNVGGAGGLLVSESMGDASRTWQRAAVGTGIQGSSYGQMAVMLDPTGCLFNIGKRKPIMKVL